MIRYIYGRRPPWYRRFWHWLVGTDPRFEVVLLATPPTELGKKPWQYFGSITLDDGVIDG
jgi:hypothetical protein